MAAVKLGHFEADAIRSASPSPHPRSRSPWHRRNGGRGEPDGSGAARFPGKAQSPRGRSRAADKEDTVHPVMLEQLAAERVKEMLTDADDARRAGQARRARRARPSRHTARPGLPRTLAEPGRDSANTATAAVPAAHRHGPSADEAQRQPDELALH